MTGHDDAPFDVDTYVDSLGPMTPRQRSIVDEAMARLASDADDSAAFLRDAALCLTTLVVLGDVTVIEEETERVLDAIRDKHRHGTTR